MTSETSPWITSVAFSSAGMGSRLITTSSFPSKRSIMEAAGSTLEMHLHLRDDGLIPLPQWAPMPTADGLKFIYQQYEVTAYVDGMPEFTLTYDEVAPYLLPEAKADLGL